MKTGWMDSRWLGRLVVTLGTASLGLLVTGCEPECVDSFDCTNKGLGPGYVCQDNRCVQQLSDAGTETDAGTDAGTETDAGTDAGVACTDVPHDARLGTLALQPGFTVTESATLPEGISNVTALTIGRESQLYGLRNADRSLYSLGTWPGVALGEAPLQAVIPATEQGTLYLSGFLTHDGSRLLAGYTKLGSSFSDVPGQVLVYDLATANAVYLSAPGNYTAAGLSNAFLINALGLEGVADSGNAVYALKTDVAPYTASRLATFPVSPAYSGATAVAGNGVAVLGYADSNFVNHLRAVAPAAYTPALTGGAAVDLTNATDLDSVVGSDLSVFDVTGFGEGVALHRGTYDPTTYAALTRDISHLELTVGGTDSQTVTAGTLTPVLTSADTCTDVLLLAPLGSDLLVGVKDKDGRRLVRLQKQ